MLRKPLILVIVALALALSIAGSAQASSSHSSGNYGGVSYSEEKRVKNVICIIFGRYCRQAIRVADCESGYNTTAYNGQYLGIFQMGSYERATYGHGSGAWAQAKAAYRYFASSGYDWSPWACKPWH